MASLGMSRSPWRWLRLVLHGEHSRAEEQPVRRRFIGRAGVASAMSHSRPPVRCSLVATFASCWPTRYRHHVNDRALRRSIEPMEGESEPRFGDARRHDAVLQACPAAGSCESRRGIVLRVGRVAVCRGLRTQTLVLVASSGQPGVRIANRRGSARFVRASTSGVVGTGGSGSYSAAAPKGMDGRCSPRTWCPSAGDAEDLKVDPV